MDTQAQRGRRAELVLLWLLVALLLGLGTMTFGGFLIHRAWTVWLIRTGVGAGASGVVWWSTRRHFSNPLRRSVQRRALGREVDLLPRKMAATLQRRVGKERTVTLFEAQVFAAAIIGPSELFHRITEQYEPERRTIRQNVKAEVQIPKPFLDIARRRDRPSEGASAAEPGTWLPRPIPFPAFVLPKGELTDDFCLRDASGTLLSGLAYSESLEIVASALRIFLLMAYNVDSTLDSGEGVVAKLPRVARKSENDALSCVIQRGAHNRDEAQLASDAIVSLEAPNPAPLRLAAELVRKLADHYAIVAVVQPDPDGRFVLCHERTITPAFTAYTGLKGVKDTLESILGARPVRLSISTASASTAKSFHLMVKCPEGLYLQTQQLPGIDRYLDSHRSSWDQGQRIPAYFRPQRRCGQPSAHFYTRSFPEPERAGEANALLLGPLYLLSRYLLRVTCSACFAARTLRVAQLRMLNEYRRIKVAERLPRFIVYFSEVPPGSLFRSAIVAWSSFALVWIVGITMVRGNGDPGTDAPAILLAFPAVAAAWLGFEAPSRRLLEGTLTARLSLLFSALGALIASGLYIIHRAGAFPALDGSVPFPIEISFLGINRTAWGILAALALANAVQVTYLALVRTWEFKYLCTRVPTDGSHVIEGG